jgi:hypothetical protein
MATTSEVKSGLDSIAEQIRLAKTDTANAKARLQAAKDRLDGLAGPESPYADIITEIQGYTPTGAFESLSKDELSKLITEFQAAVTALDTAIAAL